MVSWKRLTRWCRRRLIHLHNQNKHPHPLIWARGFAPPPKKTSLLTKSSLSSWFVQHSQPRAFVLPWLSWKILLVYFFQFGHFGGSVTPDENMQKATDVRWEKRCGGGERERTVRERKCVAKVYIRRHP